LGEKSAVLFGDIAVVNLALAFGAQEGRIGQDDTTNTLGGQTSIGSQTSNHSRRHASH
jgi:hypothetical protein